ncbi:MAG: BsaA family SipW-dependent biofilm matrix protein [Gemmiger sp.]|nr:BsaA family SipW-dependent biofilm matrix protein [Gemmiger sp.]
MKIKKRHLLLLVAMVFALGAVGGSWAYYTSANKADNRLVTLESGVVLKEIFNPADQWVAGEAKQKEVAFGNVGQADQVVRFKVVEKWFNNNGTPNNLADDTVWVPKGTYTPQPVIIDYTSEIFGPNQTWVKGADGWYYYKKVLAVGATTPLVIKSVSFSKDISNAGPGAVDDFSNKRYSLTVEMETVNVSTLETSAAWGMNFTLSGGTLNWSAAP